MRTVAILIKPFLPQTSETFYGAFDFGDGRPWEAVSYASAATPIASGSFRVTAPIVDGKPAPLFPKVEAR